MAYSIITKKRFETKVKRLLDYLIMNWHDDVADDFLRKLDNVIHRISQNPKLGIKINSKNHIRSILVTKHNLLYYRVEKKSIIILNLFDTRINPKRNPFNKPS